MRKFGPGFLDVLFCMLLTFFIMIAPDAANAPPVDADFVIQMEWEPGDTDMDIYLKTPDGQIVYFGNKDIGTLLIDHDDLGMSNDTSGINAEEVKFRNPIDGSYYVSIHNYRGPAHGNVVVRMLSKDGDRHAWANVPMPTRSTEVTLWRVRIEGGKVVGVEHSDQMLVPQRVYVGEPG